MLNVFRIFCPKMFSPLIHPVKLSDIEPPNQLIKKINEFFDTNLIIVLRCSIS